MYASQTPASLSFGMLDGVMPGTGATPSSGPSTVQHQHPHQHPHPHAQHAPRSLQHQQQQHHHSPGMTGINGMASHLPIGSHHHHPVPQPPVAHQPVQHLGLGPQPSPFHPPQQPASANVPQTTTGKVPPSQPQPMTGFNHSSGHVGPGAGVATATNMGLGAARRPAMTMPAASSHHSSPPQGAPFQHASPAAVPQASNHPTPQPPSTSAQQRATMMPQQPASYLSFQSVPSPFPMAKSAARGSPSMSTAGTGLPPTGGSMPFPAYRSAPSADPSAAGRLPQQPPGVSAPAANPSARSPSVVGNAPPQGAGSKPAQPASYASEAVLDGLFAPSTVPKPGVPMGSASWPQSKYAQTFADQKAPGSSQPFDPSRSATSWPLSTASSAPSAHPQTHIAAGPPMTTAAGTTRMIEDEVAKKDFKRSFNTYLYDYLVRNGFDDAAWAFLRSGAEVTLLDPPPSTSTSTASSTGTTTTGGGAASSSDGGGSSSAGKDKESTAMAKKDSSGSSPDRHSDLGGARPRPTGQTIGAGTSPSTTSPSEHCPMSGAQAVLPRCQVEPGSANGFLFDWWCIFWDVWRAGQRSSSSSLAPKSSTATAGTGIMANGAMAATAAQGASAVARAYWEKQRDAHVQAPAHGALSRARREGFREIGPGFGPTPLAQTMGPPGSTMPQARPQQAPVDAAKERERILFQQGKIGSMVQNQVVPTTTTMSYPSTIGGLGATRPDNAIHLGEGRPEVQHGVLAKQMALNAQRNRSTSAQHHHVNGTTGPRPSSGVLQPASADPAPVSAAHPAPSAGPAQSRPYHHPSPSTVGTVRKEAPGGDEPAGQQPSRPGKKMRVEEPRMPEEDKVGRKTRSPAERRTSPEAKVTGLAGWDSIGRKEVQEVKTSAPSDDSISRFLNWSHHEEPPAMPSTASSSANPSSMAAVTVTESLGELAKDRPTSTGLLDGTGSGLDNDYFASTGNGDSMLDLFKDGSSIFQSEEWNSFLTYT